MSTRLIIAGGTLDKEYNPLSGELDFGETHISEMLDRARYTGEIAIEELMMIDSLDMDQDDRDQLAEACEQSEEKRIVLTHGTDTMVETAKTIARSKKVGEKTIVLTGAMIPYSLGVKSDAMFNLGTALAYAELLPSGIYIAMNGRAFDHDNVKKDKERGIFVPLR